MKLLYVDESGDTIPISQGGKKFLVLTGSILDEEHFMPIENRLRGIKQKYYSNPDIEFKSNFVRNANPDIPDGKSPLKLHDRQKYNELEAELSNFLKEIEVTNISVVIDKAEFWNKYPAQSPYDTAYVFLVERFNRYLQETDSLGMVIIDPREGRVEKAFIGDHLRDVHANMRHRAPFFTALSKKTDRVIERLLYSASEDTIGIQIADMYCYPVAHIYEYDKKATDYWRFSEICEPKLRKSDSGNFIGYGLKVYPETKTDPF
jgi:Protein of unknown function (DUF3800)